MANVRISELQSAPAISGSYVLPINFANTAYKASFDQFSSWINYRNVKDQYSTSYSVGVNDNKSIITFNNDLTINITIPTSVNNNLPIGTTIDFIRLGIGSVNITGESGVIINSSSGWTLRTVYSRATVSKVNTNEWIVSGDLVLSPTPTPTHTPTVTPTVTITPSSEPFGPPTDPLNLSAYGGNEQLILAWNAPLRIRRLPITDYVLEYEFDPSVSATPTHTPTPTPTPTPSHS